MKADNAAGGIGNYRGVVPDRLMRQSACVSSVAGMEQVEAAMATPDGYWRVEVVRSGRDRWFRVWHANTVVADKAAIATVQRILGDAFSALEAEAA